MFNIFMLVISIVFLVLNFLKASQMSEARGSLINPPGIVSVFLIGLWSYMMGYHAVLILATL